jgi:aminoglycoside 2'-N-acetyltransferase I
MEILIKAEKDMPASLREAMDKAVKAAFDAIDDDGGGITWVESNDWHVLVLEAGRVVSHAGIVERTVDVGGMQVRVGGVGAVATLPELQGRGLAGMAMRRAAQFMQEDLKVDFGLLFCAPKNEPLYAHLGWIVVRVPVVSDQPGGKRCISDVLMILPCLKQAWPAGTIDLCGLPW